jgi:PPOX class probable FMN-dependent enzyme
MDVCIATETVETAIDDEAALRALYNPPRTMLIRDHLDRRSRRFIAHAPLLILGSARAGCGIDLSPRGGPPGFVQVPDDRTLVVPDRAGNNRLDTMRNLLAECQIGLFFLIPGVAETLRIKGVARLDRDPRLPDPGKVAIVVTVRSAFIHCARVLHHSRLWDADYRTDPAALARGGEAVEGGEGAAAVA